MESTKVASLTDDHGRHAHEERSSQTGLQRPLSRPWHDTAAMRGNTHLTGSVHATSDRKEAQKTALDRAQENQRWTAALTESGPAREQAADALYTYLLRAARSELARRSDSSRLSGAERDDLAHQAAADALVSIIRRLPDFRGDSMFTTWARSFVTFEVRVKIRQHNRRAQSQTLTTEDWDSFPSSRSNTPEAQAEAVELKQAVMSAMATALTARQRSVFMGVVVHGASIDQLATQLGANRNAIYQLMFHARRNLRRQLAERGFLHGLPTL